jgi:hypothetical protein
MLTVMSDIDLSHDYWVTVGLVLLGYFETS